MNSFATTHQRTMCKQLMVKSTGTKFSKPVIVLRKWSQPASLCLWTCWCRFKTLWWKPRVSLHLDKVMCCNPTSRFDNRGMYLTDTFDPCAGLMERTREDWILLHSSSLWMPRWHSNIPNHHLERLIRYHQAPKSNEGYWNHFRRSAFGFGNLQHALLLLRTWRYYVKHF